MSSLLTKLRSLTNYLLEMPVPAKKDKTKYNSLSSTSGWDWTAHFIGTYLKQGISYLGQGKY